MVIAVWQELPSHPAQCTVSFVHAGLNLSLLWDSTACQGSMTFGNGSSVLPKSKTVWVYSTGGNRVLLQLTTRSRPSASLGPWDYLAWHTEITLCM